MARRRRRAVLEGVTKKDFQAFAKILCEHGASHQLVGDLASYFKSQNPAFDSARFVDATRKCGR